METAIQCIMKFIDEKGKPPMVAEDWKGLLEDIIFECEQRHDAVAAELDEV